MAKYRPGALILIRAKIISATEDSEGKFTYKVKPETGSDYNTVEVGDIDIRGCLEEKLQK